MAYHVNGSVRGKLAVTEEDLSWLSERYDFYVRHVKEEIQSFVLPQGTEAAAALHLCRSEAKNHIVPYTKYQKNERFLLFFSITLAY